MLTSKARKTPELYAVQHCAPTLAGIKTGNLFSLQTCTGGAAKNIARNLNRELGKKGIRAIPICRPKGRYLILLFRPEYLRKDFENPLMKEILCRRGYQCKNAECVLAQLVRRMAEEEPFPHEVGLFLGYPPEDVKCFMDHPNEGVQCVGCWKAYSNKRHAEAVFEKYRNCAKIYMREYLRGKSLTHLAVGTA